MNTIIKFGVAALAAISASGPVPRVGMPPVGWWSTSWRRAFLVRSYSQKRPLVAARTHPSTAGWRRPSVLYCHTYWNSAQLLKRKYQSTHWRSDYVQRRSKHGPRGVSQIKELPWESFYVGFWPIQTPQTTPQQPR